MLDKLTFLKKKPFIFSAIAVILIIVVFFIFKNKNTGVETTIAKLGNFENVVSVSGKVIPSESVDLAFKNSGRIERIYFSVDKLIGKRQLVKAGTIIAEIDKKDAEKDVHDAEISLENTKLSLSKLKLESSDENLNANLQKAYDNGFIEVSDTFLDLSPAITGLNDILNQNNLSDNAVRLSGTTAQNYRNEAEALYYKSKNSFEKNRIDFRILSRDSSKADIEKIINETYDNTKILIDAIKSTKNLVDYIAEDTNSTTDFIVTQNTLYEYTNTINSHFSNLLSIKTSIKNYKDAFSSSNFDIQSLLLSIKQKENTLLDAKKRLNDYYIRAPFDGIITKIGAKVGEIASPNIPLITMMGTGTFQIESYVPEVNIAKILLGNEAKITLDAYGEKIIFPAKVISIDPAETIRDGVSTYKVKLQFENLDDRIKSGMTANVAIMIFSKMNVIMLPGGVVFEKDTSNISGQTNKKFVQVKVNEKIQDREVILGEVSSLGQVEIVSGVSDGDVVILNPLNSLVK